VASARISLQGSDQRRNVFLGEPSPVPIEEVEPMHLDQVLQFAAADPNSSSGIIHAVGEGGDVLFGTSRATGRTKFVGPHLAALSIMPTGKPQTALELV
jgi:hypothetical protein